jgi:hypothetical protein
MSLPPTRVLLAPPRRSMEQIDWARRDNSERDCLSGPLTARHRQPRMLSPLKCSRRSSALYVPMCVLPKTAREARRKENTAPMPLPMRVVRDMAQRKADALREARLAREAERELQDARLRATGVQNVVAEARDELGRIGMRAAHTRKFEVPLLSTQRKGLRGTDVLLVDAVPAHEPTEANFLMLEAPPVIPTSPRAHMPAARRVRARSAQSPTRQMLEEHERHKPRLQLPSISAPPSVHDQRSPRQ